MTMAPHTRNEFENYIQECIPVGYQPPACRPYVLHNEKVLEHVRGGPCIGGADAGVIVQGTATEDPVYTEGGRTRACRKRAPLL